MGRFPDPTPKIVSGVTGLPASMSAVPNPPLQATRPPLTMQAPSPASLNVSTWALKKPNLKTLGKQSVPFGRSFEFSSHAITPCLRISLDPSSGPDIPLLPAAPP